MLLLSLVGGKIDFISGSKACGEGGNEKQTALTTTQKAPAHHPLESAAIKNTFTPLRI